MQVTATKGQLSDQSELVIIAYNGDGLNAHAGDDVSSFRNVKVLLNGSRSTVPTGSTLSYLWQAVTGMLSNVNAQKATFVSDAMGTFPVALSVSA